jgi:hypothetical protein
MAGRCGMRTIVLGHASGVFTKHSGIDPAGFAMLPQRFCKAPRTTRIYNADLYLAVSVQGQGQAQTVVPTFSERDMLLTRCAFNIQ